MVRTLTEILTDMDNTECLVELKKLNYEVFDNKYKYPLVELHYCNEHTLMRRKEISAKLGSEIGQLMKDLLGLCGDDIK